MPPKLRFAVAAALTGLALLGALAAAGGVLWADFDAGERAAAQALVAGRGPLLAILAVALLLVVVSLLRWAAAAYPAAAAKLADSVRIIQSAHLGHRAEAVGALEMRRLAAAVNGLAQAHEELQGQVEARIAEANARLAQERNRLAALMSELANGVIVCNSEGLVLLYNARAARMLLPADAAEAPLGLGRSVFAVLDGRPLLHARHQLVQRARQGLADPVSHFVTTRGSQLLRARMAPVEDPQGGPPGFVLLLEDITRSVEANRGRDALLQELTQGSRAALANIRAAAETLQQYPDMAPEQRGRFFAAVRDEAGKLSAQVESALAAQGDAPRTPWPPEDIAIDDLLVALQSSLGEGAQLTVAQQPSEGPLWLSADSYALVQALAHLATRLAALAGPRIALAVSAEGRWVRLAFQWQGAAAPAGLLQEWEQQPVSLAAGVAATLREVLVQHGGELWMQGDGEGGQQLCLQLPLAPAVQAESTPAPSAEGRPVYYDFDLFNQPGQTPELDDRPLGQLACTVFDTETTGLSPSEGDEIIAIGAVRILNGRLLRQESFDRLVRPARAVRREARAVHGIANEMLAGEPPLEDVLPSFHRFAADTVLVGHNAAFDMRLLQLAETRTGLVFTQPVLDTLLLSALVHPGHADAEHRLEAIAARLGVAVIGRHSALGDALVTAEVFLRLVPLLAERGIRTLKEAREASRKTLYAKLEY